MRKVRAIVWALLAVLCVTASLGAADVVIKGTVTDSNGKPVRGAIVKATLGPKSINRYTQSDGTYELAVAPGTYDVSVDAFGFALKRASIDTAKGGDSNFTLTAGPLDVSRMTGAEMESLLTDSPQKTLLMGTCVECHSFPTVAHRRGSSQEEWKGFFPHGQWD